MTEPTEAEIEAAARAALDGELVVLPTDTVYGIGTRPDDPEATARLFEAKQRPTHLELPVLVPDLATATGLGRVDVRAKRLAERFWPGPLTVVVQRTSSSAPWDLGGDPATLGLRVPDHPTALAVLARTGPLAVTSANRSGADPSPTIEGIREVFGALVAAYLDGGRARGLASTVVDLSAAEPRILRPGPVDDEVLRLLRGS
jgi:L-threonylcarbamoyladenylate synthase